MHIALVLVVAFLLAACGRPPVQAPAPSKPAPSFRSADDLLGSYPILPKGVMTGEQMERMKLRPEKLASPLRVRNHYRGIEGWRTEELPVGTLVAVDATGRPWYKIDCSNRLYVPPACPVCPSAASAAGGGQGVVGGDAPVGGVRPAMWDPPSLGRFPWWLLPLLALPFIIWGLGRWLEGPLFPALEREDAASGGTAPSAGVSGTAFGGVGRQGGSPGTVNAARAARAGASATGAPDAAAALSPAVAATAAAPSTSAVAAPAAPAGSGVAAPVSESAVPAEAAPQAGALAAAAPPTSTVGAAITALAGQGFREVRDIETTPDGGVSFRATVRG